MKKLLPLVLMVVMVVLAACSSIECPVQNQVLTRYALSDTLHDTLTVSTVRRNRTDTILCNRGINLTLLSLPVSQQNPVDTLVFKTVRLPAIDTVWVSKEDLPQFESVDCPATYFHTITSVRCTTIGIDSVVINNSQVNYDPSYPHFIIYFKPRP